VCWPWGCGKSWSGKELDNEKSAVTLTREVERGGYKLVTAPELKAWIDQNKPMMVIDTMPLEDSAGSNTSRRGTI
jgi:hypothetical protein